MAHQDTAHQRSLLDERCARHQFEAAVDRCRQCGHAFCGECLVFSFGEKQPPFCIPCALSASGVRSNAGRAPALPKKELKRRQREADRARQQAHEEPEPTPAIDWSLPVNGSDPNEDATFPSFDDETSSRPAPPSAPAAPKGRSKGGLFGRKKNKVVPF